MKKIRKNMKMIIGIVIGVIISVTTSYVLAATLINSKDVVYQDNMSIGATNVQNAIDGTCSKIDTRLSGIEDKLYTVQIINDTKWYTTHKNKAYTGISIILPAKSYCSVTISAKHNGARPNSLALSTSSSELASVVESVYVLPTDGTSSASIGNLYVSLNKYIESTTTFYVWTSTTLDNASNSIEQSGFCATKVN